MDWKLDTLSPAASAAACWSMLVVIVPTVICGDVAAAAVVTAGAVAAPVPGAVSTEHAARRPSERESCFQGGRARCGVHVGCDSAARARFLGRTVAAGTAD